MDILCERRASPAKLEILGVYDWPLWEREPSEFPWQYDREETCYIVRGEFTVTPDGGEPSEIGPGDLAVFPVGWTGTWVLHETVRKAYAMF